MLFPWFFSLLENRIHVWRISASWAEILCMHPKNGLLRTTFSIDPQMSSSYRNPALSGLVKGIPAAQISKVGFWGRGWLCLLSCPWGLDGQGPNKTVLARSQKGSANPFLVATLAKRCWIKKVRGGIANESGERDGKYESKRWGEGRG